MNRSKPRRPVKVRRCRYCRCTEADCRECVELTGEPCYWIGPRLCSACATPQLRAERVKVRAMLAAMPEAD